MSFNTLTLSSKGQLALPKALRETDALAQGDIFQLDRQGPGKYLLQKLAPAPRIKPRLARTSDGLLVFRVPQGSARIKSQLVKELESETI
jgi:bifunctional DNA-binding transcriptional regulator/antitoxin component of YhaV-PrlF toxin-antitoxin module